jgi:predicted nucleic acid-binding protein
LTVVVDTSVVVAFMYRLDDDHEEVAARMETTRIATLDELHFRVIPPLTGEAAFTLLPADA